MAFQVDGALYPDIDPPATLETREEKIDFIARLCSAWDFGLLPDWETILEVRKETWREAVEVCNLLTSPTYHLLREWHKLPRAEFLGSVPAYIRDDPFLSFV